jgi:hypothetical protein
MATAASTALPPFRRISAPASTASGFAATTAAVCFAVTGAAAAGRGGLAATTDAAIDNDAIRETRSARKRKTGMSDLDFNQW